METEMYDSIKNVLEEKIWFDSYSKQIFGLDAVARRIIDEIVLPIRLDLVEAQAKNRVYEAALEKSNFKAIVVKNPKNGGEK